MHLDNSGVTPFQDALGERNQFPKGEQGSASVLGQLRLWWGRKIHKQTAPFFFFLIGGWLLYNVVLVSAVQQCESALSIHISPSSSASFSLHLPSHSSR